MLRALLIALCLLFVPVNAWAAFTVTDEGSASDNSGATSVQFIGASANTGDILYVAVWIGSTSGTPSLTDGTNSYTPTQSVSLGVDGKFYGFFFYYSSTQSFLVLSVTKGSTANALMTVTDITGSNGTWDSTYSSPSGASAGGITPATSAAGSAAVSGELNIAPIIWTGTATLTNSSGWTTPPVQHSLANAISSTTVNIGGGHIVNSSTSALSYSGAFSTSAIWGMFIDAFEPAGAPAASSNCPLGLLGVGAC